MEEILKAANLYATGLAEVKKRRTAWLNNHKAVRQYLVDIAHYLNANAAYKQQFSVHTNRAFHEAIRGSCAEVPSITFKSDDMPQYISFRNTEGERAEFLESGFELTFSPTLTGQIVILLLPHHNPLNEASIEYVTLAVIDEPGAIDQDAINQIVAKAIEMAYYTSFTGMIDLEEQEMNAAQKQMKRTPIGFKRYETNE
jgi:hypothetical protein